MDEKDARALVEGALGGRWAVTPSPLPGPGGPRRAFRDDEGRVAWVLPPPRVEAERRGRKRLLGHPLAPAFEVASTRVLVAPSFGVALDEEVPAGLGEGASEDWVREGPRRSLLAELLHGRRPSRILVRSGLPRRVIDRYLATAVRVRSRAGVVLGGVDPGWFRTVGDRVVTFRADAVTVGPVALDFAAFRLAESDGDDLRARHRAGLPPGEADAAFDLAEAALLLRDAARRDPVAIEGLRALLTERVPPPEVRVWVDGPAFVDGAVWATPGETVSASRARWLLRTLHGLSVGGGHLSVRTEPPIRAGRARRRSPRADRRRALFSRWHAVGTDDEGLLSLTPEALALRLAEGARGTIVDGTAGLGGLAIAFARQPGVRRVVAVERDEARFAILRHNAAAYGVATKIDARRADIIALLDQGLTGDLLLLDPPWGGRDYDRSSVALDDIPFDLRRALDRWRGPLLLKLPRSFDVASLPPGPFTPSLAVDERGVVKFLVVRREGLDP